MCLLPVCVAGFVSAVSGMSAGVDFVVFVVCDVLHVVADLLFLFVC